MLTRVSGIGVAAPALGPVSFQELALTAQDFEVPDNFANAVTTTVNIPTDTAGRNFLRISNYRRYQNPFILWNY